VSIACQLRFNTLGAVCPKTGAVEDRSSRKFLKSVSSCGGVAASRSIRFVPRKLNCSQEVSIDSIRARQGRAFPSIVFWTVFTERS
jgi:hypothetical protein